MCLSKFIALFLICLGLLLIIKHCPNKDAKRKIIEKILIKNGYHDNQNLSDFWFSNKQRIIAELSRIVKYEDIERFELQVRWESEIGKACRKSINDFIIAKQKDIFEKQQKFINDNPNILDAKNFKILATNLYEKAVIDFNDFSFIFKDKTYSLEDFAVVFQTSQIPGWNDIRGINLSNIAIANAVLRNASFNFANLSNAKFQSVEFENINFVNSSLVNSKFIGAQLIKTDLSGSDLSDAFLNALDLNEEVLRYPFKYNKISYLKLVKIILKQIFSINTVNEAHSHTSFLLVGTTNLDSSNLIDLKEYINWYQNVFDKIKDFRGLHFSEKFNFLYSLITTKYWTSHSVLILYSVSLILFFGLIFFFLRSGFENPGNFHGVWDGIYFSFMNFTSLGPGISAIPKTVIVKIIIMFESVLGYINLGTLILLMGHKVGKIF